MKLGDNNRVSATMKQKALSGIILLLIIVLFISSTGSAIAQTGRDSSATPTPTPLLPDEVPESGINLTLTPTFLNLVTDPGEEVSTQIKIKNNNNFREYLRLDLAKFEAAEGGERPLISEFEEGEEYRNWISFSEDQFVVDPNQTKTITVTVTPPEDATLGYYYTIIVNRTTDNPEVELGAVVSGAPAILALLEVRSENAKRELQLVEFTTDKFFYEYLPSTFNITAKNTGNIHIVPTGDIFVDSMGSKDVAVLRVNEGRGNILPDTERTYMVSWEDGFAVRVPKEENGQIVKDEEGNTVYTTKFDFTNANKFRIGKYTANLLMVYDNGERDIPLQATVSFWIIPWKILLAAGVILIFALLGLKSTVWSNIQRFRK